jgi:hypothetical protein
MTFVSVTRLRVRSATFLPLVAFHSWRSVRQIRHTSGFIEGYLASGPKLTLWTVTSWVDEGSMLAYRNGMEHLKAMPKLIDACDEASVAHWVSANPQLPSPAEAAAKLGAEGRLSKVRRPSPAHLAGEKWPDGRVPNEGPQLRPA